MSITLIIIVITIGISVWAWNDPRVMARWIMNPYEVNRKKQYYRLLTSGFLHADWSHLIFNMLSFYFFGSVVEQIFGLLFGPLYAIWLVGFYLVAIIVSDLPTYFKHRHNPGYNSLGASGGVSAIIFATIIFRPLVPLMLMFIPIPIPGFIFGALYLAYSYYESRRGYGNINHDAHLYGALFGIIFMAIAYPDVVPAFFEQIGEWRLF
jgi:membrane associated rhomboid family serine protease